MALSKSEVLAAVCGALGAGGLEEAARIAEQGYPFVPPVAIKRAYGLHESSRVFVRDGFLDRYTGERLIFPPVLRVLSAVLPKQFPFHPNWKTDLTHPAYWQVGATVDHLIPVTLGGPDDESNWYTTSMARNAAKMNWRLEELGWQLHPPGDVAQWDGLLGWFLAYTDAHPVILEAPSIRAWHRAAKAVESLLPARAR